MLTLPLWFGCASPPPPNVDPTCSGAYDALVADLGAMFSATGTEVTFPERAAFVARCDEAHLSTEALRCLQPAVATADPERCAGELAPAEPLASWFDAHTTIGARVR